MSDELENLLKIAGASVLDGLKRLAELGEWATSGPEAHPDIVDIVPPPHPCWENGWWAHATQRPAHPGRVGGPISPFAAVLHTCDMLPDELPALTTAWTTRKGVGACAHFVVDELGNVIQFVPINRNGNHAGGEGHGVFVDGKGRTYHPNLVTIGIELHNAGGVTRIDGKWRLVEGGKAHGMAIDDAHVIPDPRRPGHGWHRVTPQQYERLSALLADLEVVLAPMPPGTVAKSLAEPAPKWAELQSARVVGHVSLDAARRSDPWPPTMEWLRNR